MGSIIKIRLACDTALTRLMHLGLRLEEHTGESYHENSKMHVIECIGDGSSGSVISECLSPAIYFNDMLVKQAEVVIKGENENAKTNS